MDRDVKMTLLFNRIRKLACKKVEDSPIQVLIGGGLELCIYNSAAGIERVWHQLCSLLETEAMEADALRLLRERIAFCRGPLAIELRKTSDRSRESVERKIFDLNERIEALRAAVAVILEKQASSASGDKEPFFRVSFPRSVFYVHARNAEQAIDLAADKIAETATAHDWPTVLEKSSNSDLLGRFKNQFDG